MKEKNEYEKNDEEFIVEDLIKTLGFDNLDDIEKETIKHMLSDKSLLGGYYTSKPRYNRHDFRMLLALYTQNYITIKQLSNLESQNQQVINQNNKIIGLLEKINNK